MAKNEKIAELLNGFVLEHPRFSRMRSDGVFTAMCMKYFFYANPLTPFADDVCDRYIVDGSNDGGIDAIFADPDVDAGEVVVLQGKFYSETNEVSKKTLRAELEKAIEKTLRGFTRGKYSHVKESVKRAYMEAIGDFDPEDVRFHVVVCTSWIPPTVEKRKALMEICREWCDRRHFVEIRFGDDLLEAADGYGQSDEFVKEGVLRLFGRKSCLSYQNDSAVVVNISAQSLAELAREEKSLLGLNLRYHISKRKAYKDVDDGMLRTIRERPGDFWYFNNGIVIVCRSFKIVGKSVVMRDFSVVNGGQTTHNIAELSRTSGIHQDFAVMCKVIKSRGGSRKVKREFCNDIAEFTNSQKPIKQSDLYANRQEHRRLSSSLNKCGVFYVRKAGAIPPTTYPVYMVANMERIGKMGLAAVMLMPGSARNKLPDMFSDDIYKAIFISRVSAQVYADCLLLSKRYQQFKCMIDRQTGRIGKGRWFDDVGVDIVNNAETFVLSSIAFLAKVEFGAWGIKSYWGQRKNGDKDALNSFCGRMIEVKELFVSRDGDNENVERFYPLFRSICDLLQRVYIRSCRDEGKALNVSAFFKRNETFHGKGLVTDELYKRYSMPTSALRTQIRLCLGW